MHMSKWKWFKTTHYLLVSEKKMINIFLNMFIYKAKKIMLEKKSKKIHIFYKMVQAVSKWWYEQVTVKIIV